MMKNHGVYLVSTLCIGVPLLMLQAFTPDAAAAEPRTLADVLSPSGYRSVEMHRLGGDELLTLDAKINDRPVKLAIATASPVSALDRAAGAHFGFRELRSQKAVTGSLGTSKNERLGFAHGNSLELANIVITRNSFAVLNEESLGRRARATGVVGVIGGMDLLRLAAVIDCGSARLYLNPQGGLKGVSAALRDALIKRGFTRVPLRINRRAHWEVDCRFNGYASPVTIETAAVTCISERTASRAKIMSTPSEMVLHGVGGTATAAARGRVQSLSAGAFSERNTEVLIANSNFDVFGLDFLHARSAIVDLVSQSLYLRSSRRSRAASNGAPGKQR